MAHKILADVNVCLDLLLDRKPYVDFSGRVFEEAEKGTIELQLSGLSFDTLFYIIRPSMGPKKATEKLRQLLTHTKVGTIDARTVEKALDSRWNDLEDALQYYCALHNDCDFIITRNRSDFKIESSPVKVISPQEYIETYVDQL